MLKPLPKFIPVVHVQDKFQALAQTEIALSNGAGGVFLIGHQIPWQVLVHHYCVVRSAFPEAWIGLNFLDLEPIEAVDRLPFAADGLWLDNPGDLHNELPPNPPPSHDRRILRTQRQWRAFPGTDFKYQDHMGRNPGEAAELAVMAWRSPQDVITTSGPATGKPPTVDKLRQMCQCLPQGRLLALASGVTAENAPSFLPYVDCFMVASSLLKPGSFHEFDPAKVRELATLLLA